MKLKLLVTISLYLFIATMATIIGVGFIVPSNPTGQSASQADLSTQSQSSEQPAAGSPDASAAQSVTPTTNPSTAPSSTAPTPAPTPAPPACGSAGGACTTAQVAQHNNKTDCWVIYGGSYYIITKYTNSNKHQGGTSVFNSETCGRDITGYLNGTKSSAGESNEHSESAYTILNSYKVGPVQG